MSTPEKKVKEAVKRVLKSLGPNVYAHWPVSNGMGAPCLDCHGCYRGLYFAIECKAPGKVPTSRQDETIRKIAGAGGIVFVISSFIGVERIGRTLEEEHDQWRACNTRA